ncbi:MAG TPA: DUF2279 domain-containing protein [Thermoanaerobaculia bacterium]
MESAWNSFHDNGTPGFHFTQDGYFGRGTYAGGADKASHFVDSHIAARAMTTFYGLIGMSPSASRLLGRGVATLASIVTEIGDGTTKFGFSWEDALGAGAALGLGASGWDDTIGFRLG